MPQRTSKESLWKVREVGKTKDLRIWRDRVVSYLSFLIVSHVFQTGSCRSSNPGTDNKNSKKSLPSTLGRKWRSNNRKPSYSSQTLTENYPTSSCPHCFSRTRWEANIPLSIYQKQVLHYDFHAVVVSVQSQGELSLHPQLATRKFRGFKEGLITTLLDHLLLQCFNRALRSWTFTVTQHQKLSWSALYTLPYLSPTFPS